jgi:hypothetical protein
MRTSACAPTVAWGRRPSVDTVFSCLATNSLGLRDGGRLRVFVRVHEFPDGVGIVISEHDAM